MLKFKTVNIIFFLLAVLAVTGIAKGLLPIYSILIVGGIWLLLTMIGATNVRMNYFYKAWHVKENSNRQIAITFDDRVDENPSIANKIIEDGHTIANHTYSHAKNIGFFSTKTMVREIESCNHAISAAAGKTPVFFRSPFGISNPKIKRALIKTEMQPIGWSLRSFDALFKSKELIYKNIIRQVKTGDVVLLHDDRELTQEVLERLLLFLKEKKYNLVTIDQLFKSHAYR